jgi:GWxTD domain-containing protein
MLRQLLIVILIFSNVVAGNKAYSQHKVSNIDLSFQYDLQSGIQGEIISSKQDSMALVLVNFSAPLDRMKKYSLSYSLVNNLGEEITSRFQLNSLPSYFLYEDASGSQYGLNAVVRDAKYLILWLSDTVKKVRYPYIKHLARHFQSEDILLKLKNLNAAVFSSYLPVNSTIRAESTSKWRNIIEVDFYDYNFKPAKPPMSQTKDSSAFTFEIDKSFRLKSSDSILLSENGLYYFHLDESQLGKSIIVTDKQYPKISSVDLLIESLRYLATEEEYMKMKSSFNKKEMFEKFWLNNTKSEAKAKRAIKEYYKRVLETNQLFTTYKEGWKTDMGMIYILYGPPTNVFIKNEGIMWIYSKTFELPSVAFFFKHMNTAFTDQHFVLERKLEFQNLWFRTVDLWRSGKKEF